MKAKNITKILILSLLCIGISNVTPTEAYAQSRNPLTWLKRVLGGGDDAAKRTPRRAPVPRQADDAAKKVGPEASATYRRAIKDGDILLARTTKDPFFTDETGKMFSSLRTRDLIKTVGQREALDNIETFVTKSSNIGLLITGLQGIGKRRLVEMLEWTFRKRSATAQRQSWVIELDAGKPEFKSIDDFRHHVRNLSEVKEIKEADTVVFVFKNVDQFAKENGGMNLDTHIDVLHHHVSRARPRPGRPDKGDVTVKSIFTGTESKFDNLISKQAKEDAFDVVPVRGSTEILDKQEIIRRNILALDPSDTARMNDRKLHRLTLMANRFLPGEDSAARAIEMFENAVARRANFMKRTTANKAENDLMKKLRTDISKLKDDLEAVQRLNGKHAKQLQEELPSQIDDLEKQLQRASRHHRALVKLKKAVHDLEDVLENPSLSAQKRAELEEKLINAKRVAYIITDKDLAHEISIATTLPISSILKMSGRMSLKGFRQLLDETIYGQEKLKAAAMRAAEAIEYAYTTGNFPKNKPVASLFITGYQGSGKTEIATLLGQFTDGYKLFNGGDLMGDTGSALLSGAKPGYVGYEKGGELVNALAENKRLALHFDELEKVDKDVIDYLNGILNPAKATGGNGVEARSNEALFIATSNVVRQLPDNIDPDNIRDLKRLIREKAPHISPEFLDRIDEFVVVGQSTRENLSDIMTKFLDLLRKDELLTSRHLGARISPEAREKILDYVVKNEDMTGRTIMRSIKKYFETPIKSALRSGEYLDPMNGTFREIRLSPGQEITLDVAEDGGFILKAE